MALLPTDASQGPMATSVHGTFDAVIAGPLEFDAALLHDMTDLVQLLLQHVDVLITGMAAGAALVLLALLATKAVHHSAVTVPSKKPHELPGPTPKTKDELQTLPMSEVEKKLGSSPDGLSQAEATKRLEHYGPNELEEKKTNALLKFLAYFWGPIPWMIEVAVVLSGIVRHWPDFFIILLLLVANATIGFWEKRQAGNALDALKARLAIKARVKRDGKWITPAAKDLVPGDVIRLRLGDIVPADARLLDGDEVSVDQSALTGESLSASKNLADPVFSGSIIRCGEIGALVYATGGKTYFGKTAELMETAVTVSHFQKAVLRIGDYMIVLAIVLVSLIIAVGIFRGEPVLTVLQFALVLTAAAIPVAGAVASCVGIAWTASPAR